MKIRAIELVNLRRFGGQRARIDGIGDGISVLAQPNEFGKSTFFDGLHALFFQHHRSKTAQTRALQPHAGGAPEAAVELEIEGRRFRLEKRWLSRQSARVLDDAGRVIAQEDEAEAWIERLTGQGLAGPSGLLWVRQGLFGLEPEGSSAADKAERERAFSTRRDLVASVAGEIDAMTGGRRMDLVLTRVAEALARLATGTLKPRAGGEWARAVDEAAGLEAARVGLEDKARRLTEALAQRAGLMRNLQALSDPEAQAREAAGLSAAQEALQAAERHAEQMRRAASDLRLAQLTAEQSAAEIRALQDLRTRLRRAAEAEARTAAELDKVDALTAEAAGQERAAAARHDAAAGASSAAQQALDHARRAHLATAAQARAIGLASQLARAEAQRNLLEEQVAARAVFRITPAALARAEEAQAVFDRLTAQEESRHVAIRLDYAGEARVRLDGQPLEAGSLRVQRVTRLDLPGIGGMTIDPGLGAGDGLAETRARAGDALQAALGACEAPDLAAARRALSEAQRLDAAIEATRAMLAELAEGGLDALRARLAAARAEAGDTADGPAGDLAALEAALAQARAEEQAALAVRREAEARHGQLREARAGALAAHRAAETAQREIAAEAGDLVDLAARLQILSEAQGQQAEACAAAAALLERLRAEAPDLDTARAAVARLRAVCEGRQRDRASCETTLAGVNGVIGAWADEGIEEALDELRGREAAAKARAARYEREVKSLALLREALEAARRAARDTYFGPVLRELNPLLSILHPGAQLQIDDSSLLPVALLREGQAEGLDILSGGTREQLAVLTRLAFARLFARAGRAVPVILDDALVHSDDDRIEAMFTALHRVALDQQIIVLTCRQRAFASLGGARMDVTVSAL
ncbi:AAA family ATPase [Pseudotabrizicola algicola]|uniref:Chromosome segregation protein SMC n=1 Tax=Pseudotabrizicola algicola TaxID=2709381 RepID=A0A6B3RL26_9RHOB|nr:ATP-binding protein [Pseudotabrizicola algicola]NEX45588.1 hypothetical protein [Pseudotabrizicola algicola]